MRYWKRMGFDEIWQFLFGEQKIILIFRVVEMIEYKVVSIELEF